MAADTTASVPSAATSPIPNAGTSQADSRFFRWDETYADLFAHYHGSSLKEFDSSRAMTNKGKLGKQSSVNFDNELGVGYHVTEHLGVGAVVPFLVVPASTADNFILGDAGVKISHHDTVNWRGLRINTNLILQAPTSDYSKARHQKLGIKTTPSIRYDIPNSDFTVGSWNEVKQYVGVQSGANLKVWTLPYVKYHASRSVDLQLAYELDMRHVAHYPAKLTNYQHDLQPGVIWKITKKVSVNPYLQFFDLGSIRTANTGFGTIVSAALL